VLLLKHAEHLKETIDLRRCQRSRDLSEGCNLRLTPHVQGVRVGLCALGGLGPLLGLEDELVVGVDDHRKEELKALANDLSEAPLRDGLLVLAEQVLKALVENNFDLIHL